MNSAVIQRLSPEVVTLIAAGETIDSLAAAVRELAENALDAGATRISISLFPDLWRLQVADNGRGMNLTNLRECAKAHCTSKISDRADLWKITSLGFRGEALHSVAQLGQLEILSRATLEEEAGWRLKYDRDGNPVEEEAIAIAPGTIVTVSDLFATIPVRRNALPSASQQLKAIQESIYQLALCHPHVTWQVLQNGRSWFNLCPSSTAKEILPQLLKSVQTSDLQYLNVVVQRPPSLEEDEESQTTNDELINSFPSKIEVAIGLPDRCHRHRADWVRVAANGRIVRSPELEQTIIAATSRTLPRDRYPICFLHLKTDPGQIDWNRHPAKLEIYLHAMDWWRDRVTDTLEQALRLSRADLASSGHQRISQLLKVSEAKGSQYRLNPNLQAAVTKTPEIGLIELRAVAQVNKTYIVAEHANGVWLVEQHIAHERVLYEQLLDAWQLAAIEPPLILTQLTPAQLAQLQRLNLEIEPFGEQMWAARTVPEMLRQREDCAEALLELSWGGDLQTAQVAVACRSAIRNGTSLTLPQMQDLLDGWQQTRQPRTCPHGRPIYLPLEESSLARFFRRHWVIGKSHGI
ncbi:MAG: DNA mismatch repair endonuclease MutL [Cyanobacteriota bacterium]|nr:DNA mismatch repair endonuclease MutL [Cyanobacteriota bacterium]